MGETEFSKTYDYGTKLTQVGLAFNDTKDSSLLAWVGVDNTGRNLLTSVEGIASRTWVSGNYYNKTEVDNKIEAIDFTDTNTKIKNNKLNFNANTGLLTSQIQDTDGTYYNSNAVTGIASRKYVEDKIQEINTTIGGLTDTNTKNASMSGSLATDGTLTVGVTDTDGNSVSTTITGVASKGDISNVNTRIDDVTTRVDYVDNRVTNNTNSINNINNDITNIKGGITNINNRLDNLVDNDTVTTITTGDDWLNNEVTETEEGFDNKLTFNEDKLKDFISENTSDTITTVSGSGLATVSEVATDTGLHYNVDVSENVVKEIAKSVDTNTTNVSMDSDRDSDAGTATISVKDSNNNVVSATIEDVASHKELKDYKEYNEIDKSVMREVINNNTERIGNLEIRLVNLIPTLRKLVQWQPHWQVYILVLLMVIKVNG